MGQLKKKGWVKETKKADEISEEEIRKVFDIVDKDKSGSLSKREAKRACKLIGEKFGITEVRFTLIFALFNLKIVLLICMYYLFKPSYFRNA